MFGSVWKGECGKLCSWQDGIEIPTHNSRAIGVLFGIFKEAPRAAGWQKSWPKLVEEMWAKLAEELNAMRGATRTPKQWKESMSNWKHQLRSRAKKVKASQNATGGGPYLEALSAFEEHAIGCLGAMAIDGHPNVTILGHESSDVATTAATTTTATTAAASPPPIPAATAAFQDMADVIFSDESSSAETQAALIGADKESSPPILGSVGSLDGVESGESMSSKRMTPEAMFKAMQAAINEREKRTMQFNRQMKERDEEILRQMKVTTEAVQKVGETTAGFLATLNTTLQTLTNNLQETLKNRLRVVS